MKKLIITLIAILSIAIVSQVWAVEVQVTEAIPWVCEWAADENGVITCQVQPGFDSVMTLFGAIIKYFTYIAALACVLFIVINGILYSMAGINDGLKTWAKDRIMKTLMWLVVLLLSGVILNAIAPWIYK